MNEKPQGEKIDRVLFLLFAGMVFYTVVLIFCEHYFMQDGQMFQVIAGVLAGFGGCFFGRIMPSSKPHSLAPGTTEATLRVEPPTPVIPADPLPGPDPKP